MLMLLMQQDNNKAMSNSHTDFLNGIIKPLSLVQVIFCNQICNKTNTDTGS